jgi:hypothetical protein
MSDQPMRLSDIDELVWSPDQMIGRLGGDEELSQLRAFEAAFARRAPVPRPE